MKRVMTAALVFSALATVAFAQRGPGAEQTRARAPRPGPEQARIAYLAGQWNVEGVSEGFDYKATETCHWFAGGFHLVCQAEGLGLAAAMKRQASIGYDRRERTYTYHSFTSVGIEVHFKGSVNGQVWTWSAEVSAGGELTKIRATMTEQSATSYTMTMDGFRGEGPWVRWEEATLTKAQ